MLYAGSRENGTSKSALYKIISNKEEYEHKNVISIIMRAAIKFTCD